MRYKYFSTPKLGGVVRRRNSPVCIGGSSSQTARSPASEGLDQQSLAGNCKNADRSRGSGPVPGATAARPALSRGGPPPPRPGQRCPGTDRSGGQGSQPHLSFLFAPTPPLAPSPPAGTALDGAYSKSSHSAEPSNPLTRTRKRIPSPATAPSRSGSPCGASAASGSHRQMKRSSPVSTASRP